MKKLICQQIEGFIDEYLSSGSDQVLWKVPIIGYASAIDQLFMHLKCSPHQGHLLPTDLLEGAKTRDKEP
jgi:hypothetical protein